MEWAAEYSQTRAPTFGGFPPKSKDHLCVFFRGRAERDELLIPFLLEALRAGHACAFYAAEGEGEHIPELAGWTQGMVGRNVRDAGSQTPGVTCARAIAGK